MEVMAKPRQYEVHDAATGKLLAVGTAAYCAKVVGISSDLVRSMARGAQNSRKYMSIDITEDEEKGEAACAHILAAAKAWDAFCEPIRKKYGIPVYKAPEKGG